ncbi:hypothetical protein JL721_9777 [Aureococcus anophagefferens]|nr:hypothetical protein JL721_9777 [Aureococcus anophagefferens]
MEMLEALEDRVAAQTDGEGTWDDAFAAAGFELLRGYHRGDTTNYYCTVWRRGESDAAAG